MAMGMSFGEKRRCILGPDRTCIFCEQLRGFIERGRFVVQTHAPVIENVSETDQAVVPRHWTTPSSPEGVTLPHTGHQNGTSTLSLSEARRPQILLEAIARLRRVFGMNVLVVSGVMRRE